MSVVLPSSGKSPCLNGILILCDSFWVSQFPVLQILILQLVSTELEFVIFGLSLNSTTRSEFYDKNQ